MLKTSKEQRRRRWIPFVVVLSVVACGGAGAGSIVRQPGPEDFDGVMLDVINDNFYEARLYAVYGGGERHE